MEFPIIRHGVRFRSNKSFHGHLPKHPSRKAWDKIERRALRREDRLAAAVGLLEAIVVDDAFDIDQLLPKDEPVRRCSGRSYVVQRTEQGTLLIIHGGSVCQETTVIRRSTAYLNGCGPTHINNYRRHHATPNWAIRTARG